MSADLGREVASYLKSHPKIGQLKDEHARQAAAIVSNRDLSHEAQQRLLGEVRTRAQVALRQLTAEEDQALERKRQGLLNKLGGLSSDGEIRGADLIAHRDAADRASRAEDSDAATALLQRAHETGDGQLEAAAGMHAMRRGWPAAVQVWRDLAPGVVPHLDALAAMPDPRKLKLTRAMATQLPSDDSIARQVLGEGAGWAGAAPR